MKNPTPFFLLPLVVAGLMACKKPIDPVDPINPVFTRPLLTKEVETGPYEGSPEILRVFDYNQAGQLTVQKQEPPKNGGVGFEKVFTYDRLGGKLTKVDQWGLANYPDSKNYGQNTTFLYNPDQTLKLTIDSISLPKLIENKRVSFGYEGGRLTSQLIYSHEYAGGGFKWSALIPTYMIKRAIEYNGLNQVTAEVDSVWGLTSVENFDYNPIRPISPKFRGVYKNRYTYNVQGYVESEVIYATGFYSEGVLTTYTYSYNAKGLPTQITKTVHPVTGDPATTLITRIYTD
ncbi:hypothetical protein BH09BAC4_BH09BAC4_33190 [soil metagenome]